MTTIQGNAQQFGGFYGAAVNTAANHIQQAPTQQLEQLKNAMSNLFKTFFQAAAASTLPQVGQGFAQQPGAQTPGFVPSPTESVMNPVNPMSTQTLATGINNPTNTQTMPFTINNNNAFFVFVPVTGKPPVQTTPAPAKPNLTQFQQDPPGYETPGGYKIVAEGKDAAWKIIDPEGAETRIWGDPHVHESDGGKWDFKKQMTFGLPDGTKITVKTTPPRKNGYTVSQSIDIMNGDQRATISGIDKNKPETTGIKNDRWAVDAATKDGDVAILGGDGNDWYLSGKSEIVGSEKQGEILKTKSGDPIAMTQEGLNTMLEFPASGPVPGMPGMGMPQMPGINMPTVGTPPINPNSNPNTTQQPIYGGQQFMMQMMNQLMSSMFQLMQQSFSGMRTF
ncbi:MAG TPA: hypothetical protein DCE42_10210 [Myxococcales bacterium]|nr:hypothetical protein [Deltaproteobacteria bacterium]MBU48106.1 hypothetical protein [Deltaproteobacteria bacterium]HAA55123.1 hypothetical protein [Myxococcales bacterium]|tara:strand:+ start:11276 stop:12454 length:1179 start_codon:yes stop_codon:yes gene_type:complete